MTGSRRVLLRLLIAGATIANPAVAVEGKDTPTQPGEAQAPSSFQAQSSPQVLTKTGERLSISRTVSLMTTQVTFDILIQSEKSTDAKNRAKAAIDSAVAEFNRIEHAMSEWRPDSPVSEINQQAGLQPVQISAELYRLLTAAQQVSVLSQGAFDITFKSAGKLWDFRHALVPTQAQVRKAVKRIDFRKLILAESEANGSYTAFLTTPETQIGLGGIAKGYAIDRAKQILTSAGFEDFSINAGGDLYVAGKTEKKLWKVGIQHPRNNQHLLASMTVNNLAVATSGDYERYFIKDGERFSHIIDPATGYPANGCQSVTIIATRAFWADALATAVFVMGPKSGLQLVETLEGVEALIVDQFGEVTLSTGFSKAVEISPP